MRRSSSARLDEALRPAAAYFLNYGRPARPNIHERRSAQRIGRRRCGSSIQPHRIRAALG
jgi:hypothetical protein